MKSKAKKVWMAVYTKPRSEKKIAQRLSQQGLEVYCPVQTTLRQWSDRKKKVSIPVFPSYVFLRISNSEHDIVLQDPAVLNFVYWLGQPAIVRNEEIEGIQDFLDQYKNCEISLVNFKQGDRVDIKAGPLLGQSGQIIEVRNGIASLTIKSMGFLMRVRIDTKVLEKPSCQSV